MCSQFEEANCYDKEENYHSNHIDQNETQPEVTDSRCAFLDFLQRRIRIWGTENW